MAVWKKTTAALIAAAALATVPMTALAAPQVQDGVLNYVALGDSLTVGWEPDTSATNLPYGFVERVYEQGLLHGRTEMKNWGLGGLTSTGLYKLLDAVMQSKQLTAKDIQPNLPDPRLDLYLLNQKAIRTSINDAELITLTIGGNDFWDFQNEIIGKTPEQIQQLTTERLTTYAKNMSAIISMLVAMNPQAEIVIADQYSPIPPTDPALYAALLQVNGAFTKTAEQVVATAVSKGVKIKVAHVAQSFVGHEAEYTHIASDDIHPNQLGYDAMANVFAKEIWGAYTKPAVANAPLTLYVQGQAVPQTALHLIGDTSYVPVRTYAEQIGATVVWDATKQAVTVTKDGRTVGFTIGSNTMMVDGKPVVTPGTPHLMENNTRLYVPVRPLFESLGYEVTYETRSRTAYINK